MIDRLSLTSLQFLRRRTLPVLIQTEAAECGLACVTMIANYHGHRTDLSSVRARFEVSRKGSTLADLVQVAAGLQFAARALRVELDELSQLEAPCILHWDFNHFVVLHSVRGSRVVLHDPAIGVRELSVEEVSRRFTGVVLELRPIGSFKARDERQRVRLRDLVGEVHGWRSAAGQVMLLALALEVFAIVGPFYLQWVVDSVLSTADRDLLTALGLGFVLLVLVQQAVAAARSWVVVYVGTLLNYQWLTNVFSHLLRLPTAYFEKRHLGDVYSRFESTTTIQRILTHSFVEAILDGLMAVITLVMLLIYSPTLAAITVAAVATYGVLRWMWYRPLRVATEEQIVHAAKQQSHFFETVRGVRSIQLFGREDQRRASWLNLLGEQVNAQVRTERLTLAYKAANGVLFGVERVAVIWLAALLVLDQKFSVGMLFAFIAYKDQFAQRVSALIDKAVELKMLQLQGERLADIVFTQPEADDPPARAIREPLEPSIELRDVRFRYADGEPWVLDGVSLCIRAGESVAIVGPSGCGKTTLLKVMIGLFKPASGDILVGGVPVARIGMSNYRRMIGTALQDDQLFAGSLLQNICFFDTIPDDERIEHCARLAGIHDEIMAMPMGYNTLIGDMGSALSGGQQQRVLLARALYKQPALLFLDESTSHLDVARERQVNAAIQKLAVTRIIIAHRPETIAMADRVIRIDGGRVVSELRAASSAR
ncbi:colicin V biosynthesis protein [Steroidobacter agaridevorans]|uniref:Colicin V biosynthesis protein n=1 Tax=Steroidobacter agaridevorans TaxID=2695856 RepID=A0A829YAK1_9GAMM|nr:peptidase domain-containing ABC transporter [Steroidobacter agaridevorans]GFE80210.1 colicin V biosynthesis protein [Steroidobacter agaridevorans]